MRVPILTDRQFEILELLAVGATRQEIASELGISPETVKAHTKTIIDKFDATNVRDAMTDINDYLSAFGSSGLGLTSCFHSIHGHIQVSADFQMSLKTWITEETIIRGRVDEIHSLLDGDGDVSDVLLNGAKPELEKADSKNVVVRMKLDQELLPGDRFRRELQYRTRRYYPDKVDSFSFTINSPVQEMKLCAAFDGPVPKDWDVVLQRGFKLVNLSNSNNVQIETGKNSIAATFSNMSRKDIYMIRWFVDQK
jgi:DNA-binding CsgD family transcriptional regulator